MGKKIDQLRQELADAKRLAQEHLAGQVHQHYFADLALAKCHVDKLRASGVILTITGLGGKPLVDPVLIRDGLSAETIDAIRADLRRSYGEATAYKPKGC